MKDLPSSLKVLSLYHCSFSNDLQSLQFVPKSIVELRLIFPLPVLREANFCEILAFLPDGLERLVVSDLHFQEVEEYKFPKSLKNLEILGLKTKWGKFDEFWNQLSKQCRIDRMRLSNIRIPYLRFLKNFKDLDCLILYGIQFEKIDRNITILKKRPSLLDCLPLKEQEIEVFRGFEEIAPQLSSLSMTSMKKYPPFQFFRPIQSLFSRHKKRKKKKEKEEEEKNKKENEGGEKENQQEKKKKPKQRKRLKEEKMNLKFLKICGHSTMTVKDLRLYLPWESLIEVEIRDCKMLDHKEFAKYMPSFVKKLQKLTVERCFEDDECVEIERMAKKDFPNLICQFRNMNKDL